MAITINKLKKSEILWAMHHIKREGDTDLLGTPFEHTILWHNKDLVSKDLSDIDVSSYVWHDSRRFMAQKDATSFRSACQLDPIDAIFFSALIYSNRKKFIKYTNPYRNYVFSHQLKCEPDGLMYNSNTGWEQFWRNSIQIASNNTCQFVVVTDIVDFYNQIYHHTLENQLKEARLSTAHITSIKNLLQYETDKVSRGIPVGPHSSHILAELSMVPIDGFLIDSGISYCRYVDDIHIFVESRAKATIMLGKLAYLLDLHKLCMNKSKTKILTKSQFIDLCQRKISNDPINDIEEKFLDIVKENSNDPYDDIDLDILESEKKQELYSLAMDEVLQKYLKSDNVDYPRIGWLLRRLSQVGIPGAAEFVVNNLDGLLPVISGAIRYISNIDSNEIDSLKLGELLCNSLKNEVVLESDYLMSCIIGSYANCPKLNHFSTLQELSGKFPMVTRKIVLAARAHGRIDWIRGLKRQIGSADPWLKRAIFYSYSILPADEAKTWLKHISKSNCSDLMLKYTINYAIKLIK